MKLMLAAVLLMLLLLLQYRLWFAEGNMFQYAQLKQQLADQKTINSHMQRRNQILAAKIVDLQQGMKATEEIARQKLGMIRNGETFFLIPDDHHSDAKP